MNFYRPDIDGLRALAIVTVVACHIGLPGWSGGYVGVDVFFVISGYLITSLLVSEAEKHGRIDPWAFYARRIRRLLPAFLFVMASTLALGAAFLVRLDGEQQALAKAALAALLFNANHYFWRATGGYFSRPAELQPLLHTWSLSVEEQFYLVWPIGLIFLLAQRATLPYRKRVLYAVAAIALVSLLASVLLMNRSPSAVFYVMPFRAWELAIGAILAVLPSRIWVRERRACGAVLGSAGLAAIGLAVTLYDRATPFPGLAALPPVLGTAALLAGNALAPKSLIARFFALKPVVIVGLLSYSWYLWHWPLISIARSVQLGANDLLRNSVMAGVGFVLAAVTYRWVERPVRWGRFWRAIAPRTTVALGAGATFGSIVLTAGLGAWAAYGPQTPNERRMIEAQLDRPPLYGICESPMDKEPSLAPIESCVRPAGATRPAFILLGDSHADHWMPGLTRLAEEEEIPIYQVTRDYCPPRRPPKLLHSWPPQIPPPDRA